MKIFHLASCFANDNVIFETISVEINLKKKRKWFLNGSYKPYRNSIFNRLDSLNSLIGEYIETDDNFFIGDFYVSMEGISMKSFCNLSILNTEAAIGGVL